MSKKKRLSKNDRMILKTKLDFRWIYQLGKKKSMLRAPGRHIWKISQNLVKRKQRDVKWDSVISSIIYLIWVVEGVNIGKGEKALFEEIMAKTSLYLWETNTNI